MGPSSLGTSAGTGGSTSDASTSEGDTEPAQSSGEPECAGQCEPGDVETRPCPGQCAVQERTCADDCTWPAWSVCGPSMGPCSPGETMTCGMCMEQTCGDDCQWGACEAAPCNFVCQSAARNGDEICDDEGFQMPEAGPLFLYCEDGNGGVAYVSNNTGPVMKDGVARCQGWETMGLAPWDHLEYVHMMDCDVAGKYLQIDLPPGTISHYGVHDQPDGSGHFTTVCVATLAP